MNDHNKESNYFVDKNDSKETKDSSFNRNAQLNEQIVHKVNQQTNQLLEEDSEVRS